jgi:hypothetical protein
MHRTDGDANYPTGYFSEGDPLVPRLPTQVDSSWLNDVQEELVAMVVGAGLTLVKGTVQLGAVMANLNVAQTFTALKSFLVSGKAASFTNANGADTGAAVSITHSGRLALAVDGSVDVGGGTHTVQGSITSTGGHVVATTGNVVASTGDINAPLGTVTGRLLSGTRLVGTGNGDPGTPALQLPIYASGFPTTIVPGDVWLQTSGGGLRLYVQTGPTARYYFEGTLYAP